MVKLVGPKLTAGTPEIRPELLLNVIPLGISGRISHVLTSPPKTIAESESKEMLVVRLTCSSPYASSRGESSTVSNRSHNPSSSLSPGYSSSSSGPVKQAVSSESDHPSPSSSSSVMSGSPSPSVSSSDAEMLMVNDAENAELFAQMTKPVALKTVVGVPTNCPVELFILSPWGNCG